MALSNYQFSFNGLTIGAGTVYPITTVDGVAGLPSLRVQDDNRGFNDGAFTGRDFYDGRTITFDMLVLGTQGGDSAQQNLQVLQNTIQPQQTGTKALGLKLSPSDSEKTIQARIRSRKILVDPEYTFGYIKAQLTAFCPDPRFYDATSQSVTVNPAPTIYGRRYNRTYNMTYGTAGSVTASVNNAGNIYTSPVITVTGEASNPTFTYTANGVSQSLRVNVVMGASDVLVIDTGNRTVTLNGTASRNLVASGSSWFVIDPASQVGSPTITFTITNSPATAPTAIIAYSNAYI